MRELSDRELLELIGDGDAEALRVLQIRSGSMSDPGGGQPSD